MDFGPYGIIFINVCFITVAMKMPLRDCEIYEILFMNVCYNPCHDNAVKGFGSCGLIFMTM
jgi:hypothetical protein